MPIFQEKLQENVLQIMPLDSKSRGRDKRGDVFQKVEKAVSASKDNGNKNKAVVQADINWRRCCLFSIDCL